MKKVNEEESYWVVRYNFEGQIKERKIPSSKPIKLSEEMELVKLETKLKPCKCKECKCKKDKKK